MTEERYQPLLAEIGRVIVQYSQLEAALHSLVVMLIDDYEHITRIIPAQLSFQQLRDLIVSLYRERHGEDRDLESIQSILAEAAGFKGDRDKIAHSRWVNAGCASLVTRVKSVAKEKCGYKTSVENLSVDNLSSLADSIHALRMKLGSLAQDLLDRKKLLENPVYPNPINP